MLQRWLAIGYIGKEVETKNINDVTNVCKFSLATNKSWKDKNGDWQTETQWHNIVAWRGLADYADDNLKKGSFVYVEGEVKYRTYEKEDGTKMYFTEIVANKIKLLEKKEKSDNGYFPDQGDYYGATKDLKEPIKRAKEDRKKQEIHESDELESDLIDDQDLPF